MQQIGINKHQELLLVAIQANRQLKIGLLLLLQWATSQATEDWHCIKTDNQTTWRCSAHTQDISHNAITTQTHQHSTDFNLNPTELGLSEEKIYSITPKRACFAPYTGRTFGSVDKQAFEAAPVYIEADRTELEQNGRSILAGDVHLKKFEREIMANVLFYDEPSSTVDTTSGFKYVEPGFALVGQTGSVELNSKDMEANDVVYRVEQNHARGSASYAKRTGEGIVTLDDATFTTCAPGDNAWSIFSHHLDLNPNTGVGKAYHTQFKVKDVPIAYFPYYSFPLDDRRKSGFLAPTFGSSDDTGTDISIPYYWNIAPNYDATLTPRYMSRRGYQLKSEGRYLLRGHHGEVYAEYLPEDRQLNEDRYLLQYDHLSQFTPYWSGEIDFTKVSDDEYFDDLDDSLSLGSLTHLNQEAQIKYEGEFTSLLARAQGFQSIDDDEKDANRLFGKLNRPYRRLPQVLLGLNYPQLYGFDLGLQSEFVYFDREDSSELVTKNINGTPTIVRERRATDAALRVDLEPSISYPIEAPYGYIIPTLKYKFTHYRLSKEIDNVVELNARPNVSRTFDRSMPIFTLDSQLFLERETTFLGNEYIQTLEPRLFYLYVPERDQETIPVFDSALTTFSFANLFRDNRFSGVDRVGDANQISLAVSSRLLSSKTRNQQLLVRVGQIFFLRDREVNLNVNRPDDNDHSSALFGDFTVSVFPDWLIRGAVEYDYEENSQINRGSFSVRYDKDNRKVLNAAYLFRRDAGTFREDGVTNIIDQHQTQVSAIWPLFNQVSALGGVTYDFSLGHLIESFWGVEYKHCCWAVRFVAHRKRERDEDSSDPLNDTFEVDTKYFLQIQLRGLMGVGKKSDNLLTQGIPGYDPDLSRDDVFVNHE